MTNPQDTNPQDIPPLSAYADIFDQEKPDIFREPSSKQRAEMERDGAIDGKKVQNTNIIAMPDQKNALNTVVPHNIQAEKALLGAIMMDRKALEAVEGFLCEAHFCIPEHGKIFDVCRRISDQGQNPDAVALDNFFKCDQDILALGGSAYLVELASSAVTIINAGEYGRIISDNHKRRELIYIGQEAQERARRQDGAHSADDEIEATEHALYALASTGEKSNQAVSFKSSLEETLRQA